MNQQARTFRQFTDEMIAYAKEVQGDNYAGDDYEQTTSSTLTKCAPYWNALNRM